MASGDAGSYPGPIPCRRAGSRFRSARVRRNCPCGNSPSASGDSMQGRGGVSVPVSSVSQDGDCRKVSFFRRISPATICPGVQYSERFCIFVFSCCDKPLKHFQLYEHSFDFLDRTCRVHRRLVTFGNYVLATTGFYISISKMILLCFCTSFARKHKKHLNTKLKEPKQNVMITYAERRLIDYENLE